MKCNFSVYTSFWDRVFGTLWTDRDLAKEKYESGMKMVKQKTKDNGHGKEGL